MRILKSVMILAAVAAFVSCTTVKVVTDIDKSVDFTQYETYSFLGWQENSDRLLNDLDRNRLHDAFGNELEARGMSYVESGGDMDITLFVVVDRKTTVTAYNNYYGGGYGYGGYGRYHGGWGYGSGTTTYSERDYLEGTLVLDAFDGKTKNQIWQGVATSAINENPAKREQSIPKKVKELMYKFPVSNK
jgi:hypothetical protein